MALAIRVREARLGDKAAIKDLVSDGFGPSHSSRSVWQLRHADAVDELGLIAEDSDNNSEIIGTLQFWPITIAGLPCLLLGPLAVKHILRGKGVGRLLVSKGIEQIMNKQWAFCLVSGEPDYYSKFGFMLAPSRLIWPGEIERERLQICVLQDNAQEKFPLGDLLVLSDVK